MKKKIVTYILWTILPLLGLGVYAVNIAYLSPDLPADYPEQNEMILPQDTLTRYPVTKTVPEEYEDLSKQNPADLRTPENIKTYVEYDTRTGSYVVRSKVGEMEIITPLSLTPEEYQNHSLQESIRSYYRKRNEEEFQKATDKEFNITDMQFDIGPAERIFGPGGVRVKTQGSADITVGLKNNKVKDLSLPVRSRSRTFFNFDENVQLDVQASVGNKVNFNMRYNTQTSFDFDSKSLKLAYQGDEDEIIKNIEAGNVSMTTNNSLIRGGAALFGMKADLQFGKLRLNTLFAQQESESKTVSSKGGVQTKPFEITVDQYDENRHFFLSHYFYEHYDEAISSLPSIKSSIRIERVELWVTNKRSNFDQARNIVAFSDLGEHQHIGDPLFVQSAGGGLDIPSNEANDLYKKIAEEYPDLRDIGKVTQALASTPLDGGKSYEKIESARRLNESEYTLNDRLGYISLRMMLQPDEVLAVAFSYTYNGVTYQVGEFSSDQVGSIDETTGNSSACLYVKLLKGTTNSPAMPFWKLMMKNIYSLNAYGVQKEKFKMDILFQSDTTGTYINYIPDGAIQDTILLRVMNLDRLNNQNERYPDGFFDYVEGYTIQSDNGRIIFPVVEPFGAHLRKRMNSSDADKYVFEALYDSTLTVARQIAEKNKFLLRGEYKASSGAEIDLGATNVARGSVRVTAGGAVLTENVDYTVDYTSGRVIILNESIISSQTPVSVSLENQSTYSRQRKTMLGLDLNYEFSKNFLLGATVMHMSEMPLTVKTKMGDESIKNTLWGFNASYKGQSQWLTNMLDKIPLLNLSAPSQISFNAEFAHLIAGHYENKFTGGYSYLDDFESTQSGYNLQNPYSWQLSSTPYHDQHPLFPEANLINDIDYGKNRALLAWYYIDGIFNRPNSTNIPGIDKAELSNHYVRAIPVTELYPKRELGVSDASTLPILNLAYYPNERGPYNLDSDGLNNDGTLADSEKRWGGIMRKVEQSDFETANIEYIEFWLLDPYLYDTQTKGGDLYFNLGEISEDILKDEKKFFENGLPADADLTKVEETVWGRVPKQQSTVYGFDNTANARIRQDVGLNGLSSEEEAGFGVYKEYLDRLPMVLAPEVLAEMANDPTSPFEDPAGDNYLYYRDDYYERKGAGILERYKRYNGTENNSKESDGRYNSAAKTVPDVEDINQDNTLNENEKYFEYKVSLRTEDLKVGTNYIVDVRDTTVRLANNEKEKVKWYLFKIPIKKYNRTIGSITDFKTIRFIRMYMTGFYEPTILRFGSLELVRGEWRTYEQDLHNPNTVPIEKGTVEVSTINIEENSDRVPVSYVLPPGVTRMFDHTQPQNRQENEQALSMKIDRLAPQDARAIYKNTNYDLRQYKRLQLFTHAEKQTIDETQLASGELSVFIRLGSDYKNNYYEYEVPLKLTPHGTYTSNNSEHQLTVWPLANTLNFRLEVLTDLKLERNKEKRNGVAGVDYHLVYSKQDPDNPLNRRSIVGNPSLAEVKTIMIGVRNNSKDVKSGEVWVNELRLTDFNEDGGWAANASLNIALSDFGNVNATGRIETAGFGGLDQSLMERRMDDYKQVSVSTNFQLGRFFPEKAKVNIPFYYTYSKETIDPKYNPLDQDILLKDALDNVATRSEKDSIRSFAQERTTVKSVSFNNVKVDVRSKTPMPYDPANFSLGYSFSENNRFNPETEYETTKDYRGNFAYNYTPYVKPFKPFEKMKDNAYTKFLKQLGINYLPANISFQTSMMRNYYEIQLRDLSNTGLTLDPSFSQNFIWDRAFSLRWNLTSNLNLSFNSGTNARIEEPHVQVNRQLNGDQYQMWKDSIQRSIRDLGSPLRYDQKFQLAWTLPLQSIPILDWITSTVKYDASYNWDRGATVKDEELEIGNVIRNQRSMDGQVNLNFQGLYNKSEFLKKVNQKFTPKTATPGKEPEKKKAIKREIEITLNPDSGTIVNHMLLTKKVHITARTMQGKSYPVKYKPINMSEAMILNQDTVPLKLTITPGGKPIEGALVSIAEYSSRFLMMLRRINVQYTLTDGMMLPGFKPEIGDIFGQNRGSVLAPGLGFAFGDVRRSFIDEADQKQWLIKNGNNLSPAIINKTETFSLRTNLEPIIGLRIDLTTTRNDTRKDEIQYMYAGMPEKKGGNFTMTTIALRSAFSGAGNVENGYASASFNKFLENREILSARLENRYGNTRYPNQGFLAGMGMAGEAYNPEFGSVNKNSADVLIPAFLSAYTGKDPKKISFSPLPGFLSLLPNWTVSYDGLLQIPFMKKRFKSFILSHAYRCTYTVSNYTTLLNWVGTDQDNLGFIRNVQSGMPTPSSPYDINTVSINEGFSPLLGADATLLNNMTGRLMYNTTRTLSLNISSFQIVEALNNEIVVGVGYKITEFNKVLKRKASQNFSNDLNIRFDFSYRKMQSLIRKIEQNMTQATSGNVAKTLMISADYAMSRALTLRAFYDLQINEPLISSTSYPTSNSNFGISVRFSLAQ